MGQFLSRSALLIAIILLVCGANDSFGRGPGGPGGGGGPGGARSGGAPGGGSGKNSLDLSKRDAKQEGGSKFTAGGLQGKGGDNAAKKFQGKPGDFNKNNNFNPQQVQTKGQLNQRDWRAGDGKFQQNPQNAFQDFNNRNLKNGNIKNGPQPFSAEWFAAHPNAWQSTHPHADAWTAATATGVAAWLGWGAQPVYGTSTSSTVVYQEAAAADSGSGDDSDSTADGSEWLSLGVYSVLSNSGDATSRQFQLAVNRQGDLRGVYYDSSTGTSENVSGSIDQSTQVAEWSLDSNPQVTFRAKLSALTQPTGTVDVRQPAGHQQWRIARQENAS